MGLHICNYCEYKTKCENAFKNSLMCTNINPNIKREQERRFDNTDFKEFTEFLKENAEAEE